MNLEIKRVCTDNSAIVASIPGFSANLGTFELNISLILAAQQKQETDITGFAATKRTKRNLLTQLTLPISRRLHAFSVNTNNQEIEAQIDFSKHEILSFVDLTLFEKANLVHTIATDNLASLTTYNITQLMLDNLHTAAQDFFDAITDPNNAIQSRSSATVDIKTLIHQNDLLLHNMDILVEIIADSQTAFYTDYHNARKIYDLGHREISIEGKIIDSATKVPLRGAKVEILETGAHTITRQTGKYRFLSLQGGNYSMLISKENYKNQLIQDIPIVEGKMYNRNIQLELGENHYNIPANTDIIPWFGSTDSNLLITVINRSNVDCNFFAYFTQSPSEPMTPQAISLQPGQQHQFRVADFAPTETIYLHLNNQNPNLTALYALLFENEIQQ